MHNITNTNLKASDSMIWEACSLINEPTKVLRLLAEYTSAKENISQQLFTERTVAKNSSARCSNPRIWDQEADYICMNAGIDE